MKSGEPAHFGPPPVVEIFDHGNPAGDLATGLRRHSADAIERCLACEGADGEPLLSGLERIEVSLMTDAAIAEVHGRFLGRPDPTDVITFQHGEILISAETAIRVADEHGHSADREALLYLIHGLLHLNGFDDRTEESRIKMERAQQRILDAISPFPESENPG